MFDPIFQNPLAFMASVFILSLFPFLIITYKIFFNQLGPEPVKEITHHTGEWTLIFIILTFGWYIFYAMTFLDIPNNNEMFREFAFYYEVYVCLLLIGYFNPYTNIKLTKVKRQMVFSAALMLLFSIGINNIFNKINKTYLFIKEKVGNY